MTQRASGPSRLTAQVTVTELLAAWPEAATVFVRRGMACVGCEMSGFDTLADAAQSYYADLDALLHELSALIDSAGSREQA